MLRLYLFAFSWSKMIYLKLGNMLIEINKDFQKSGYYLFFWLKGLQSCEFANLNVRKEMNFCDPINKISIGKWSYQQIFFHLQTSRAPTVFSPSISAESPHWGRFVGFLFKHVYVGAHIKYWLKIPLFRITKNECITFFILQCYPKYNCAYA